MIKRVNAILFRFLVCVAVFSTSMIGQSYADPSGSFEVPEVNDDFTKVNPSQGIQPKKEEDQTTWLGKLLKWTGAAKDQKELEKLSEQANNEFFDGFIKKSAESLLGYDLYTGEPLKGERKKDADRTLSGVVDCIPVISNIKSFIDFTSGKDTISGDKLDPVDKVITVIGIASGPGKKAGTILKGVFNGGKKFLKRFGIRIDDLADRLGLGPRLQPAGGPPDIPRKPEIDRIDGSGGRKGNLKVNNMDEFFNLDFGKRLRNSVSKTKARYNKASIYRIDKKVDNPYLKKGDGFYIDTLHYDHIEVVDKRGKVKVVLNLDGTINYKKTEEAKKQGRKVNW